MSYFYIWNKTWHLTWVDTFIMKLGKKTYKYTPKNGTKPSKSEQNLMSSHICIAIRNKTLLENGTKLKNSEQIPQNQI